MSLKNVVLVNMVAILMLTKLDTPDLPKIKIFWNKGYDVTVFVNEATSKTLSRDSNYKVDVIMWPKFGDSSIPMRQKIITSILQGFDQKIQLFSGVLLVQVQ